ncbi:9394_t:CDS:2 [Funneliformis caledonium]|uniref:9394_t:CDS:1 n=1 Tax=Funneliformis caledonium TaxID=1117310 RepID=A0A9N9A4J2_9GLOM|nr:9394_t:CDS:2 [Funneliformis caledonium]
MISIQTDENFDELEEKEIQWHISLPENSKMLMHNCSPYSNNLILISTK